MLALVFKGHLTNKITPSVFCVCDTYVLRANQGHLLIFVHKIFHFSREKQQPLHHPRMQIQTQKAQIRAPFTSNFNSRL